MQVPAGQARHGCGDENYRGGQRQRPGVPGQSVAQRVVGQQPMPRVAAAHGAKHRYLMGETFHDVADDGERGGDCEGGGPPAGGRADGERDGSEVSATSVAASEYGVSRQRGSTAARSLFSMAKATITLPMHYANNAVCMFLGTGRTAVVHALPAPAERQRVRAAEVAPVRWVVELR